ncbi:dethiobiotin synthase [Oecophyllibacter saccharovorans]|uniref:ATP-dependent dethiobiotin synthetase BioD n=1 Tax=Oecophyllibacter saccharovorans TaxID=2558360 RepID=A0A506ULK8_9PROT|nr:dethiobiotin synthase [Oecophyllibacter saccharovorans]TPW34053.1 dethiobiotin synthase [Oecophyllibacter saccharovorans]
MTDSFYALSDADAEGFNTCTPESVFVTGTDTGIGKTLVSAILVRAWKATYWKPYQTGLSDEAGDGPEVRALSGCAEEDILPPAALLQAPLSPLAAAQRENRTLHPLTLELPRARQPLVVEGAGGLMVPIAPGCLMIDLIAHLKLPVVLVARGGLGTLNHTLLSLEALHHRGLPLKGIVYSANSPAQKENRHLVETFCQQLAAPCLFTLPDLDSITPRTVQVFAEALSRRSPPTRAL